MTQPPEDALPLLEALQRFSEPKLLAELPHGRHPHCLWCPGRNDPWLLATNAFFEALHDGKLLCGARHESPVAPWAWLPGAAWRHIQVDRWPSNTLCRMGTRPAQVMRRPIKIFERDGKSFFGHGDPVVVTENQMFIAERWFDARAALAPMASVSSANAKVNGRPPKELEDWYVNEHIPAGYFDRDEDLTAARKRFGRWIKDKDTMRELRRRFAPPTWKMSGPRSGRNRFGRPEFQNRRPE